MECSELKRKSPKMRSMQSCHSRPKLKTKNENHPYSEKDRASWRQLIVPNDFQTLLCILSFYLWSSLSFLSLPKNLPVSNQTIHFLWVWALSFLKCLNNFGNIWMCCNVRKRPVPQSPPAVYWAASLCRECITRNQEFHFFKGRFLVGEFGCIVSPFQNTYRWNMASSI